MMKLSFVKVNPADNMTVFILDPVARLHHSTVAERILQYGNLHAEQVGFVESPTLDSQMAQARLQMMGGEFCGNATRALAAVLVERGYPGIRHEGGHFTVCLEVSGTETPVCCQVVSLQAGQYWVEAVMPLPQAMQPLSFVYEGARYTATLVRYSGIDHVVLFTELTRLQPAFIEAVKTVLPPGNPTALGLMLYHPARHFLTPVVHIPATHSEMYEHGCGSGSTALATVMALQLKQSMDFTIAQPGGCLEVGVTLSGQSVAKTVLKGAVQIVAEGQVRI